VLEIPDEADESKFNSYTLDGTYRNVLQESSEQSATAGDAASAGLNEQGMQLMKSRSYSAAAAKFTQAFQLDPNQALFANNVGYAWYRDGKSQDAILWFNQTISLDPKRAIAYLNLGDAYAKLNRNAEARQAYTKYLELAPASQAAPDVKKKLEALPRTP
jgi:Flp pilus assembly protein TadD